MAYVDTNVILAKYFPEDKLHAAATAFLELSRKRKIASPVSMVELASVVSRLQREISAPKEILQEPARRRIRAIVEFMIRDCNVTLMALPARARIKLAGAILSVPLEYHRSIALAHALELKTLDLVHLAYADTLRNWGNDVEIFVTGDKGILYNSEKIHEQLGIEIKPPSESL
jgi:predicted nucleic acid-binding protein